MNNQEGVERVIDHTILKPVVSEEEIIKFCQEAGEYNFINVCIPPFFVTTAKKILENTQTGICTVVGFPLGYNKLRTKIEEIKVALEEGADEIDAVVNLAAVKSGNWDYVANEIDRLNTLVKLKSKVFKLIFETALLTKEEILQLCDLSVKNQIDFAKTSTGFNGGGASIEAVKLMKDHLSGKVRIKASGGIRTYDTLIEMMNAGAARIGTSSGVQIVLSENIGK